MNPSRIDRTEIVVQRLPDGGGVSASRSLSTPDAQACERFETVLSVREPVLACDAGNLKQLAVQGEIVEAPAGSLGPPAMLRGSQVDAGSSNVAFREPVSEICEGLEEVLVAPYGCEPFEEPMPLRLEHRPGFALAPDFASPFSAVSRRDKASSLVGDEPLLISPEVVEAEARRQRPLGLRETPAESTLPAGSAIGLSTESPITGEVNSVPRAAGHEEMRGLEPGLQIEERIGEPAPVRVAHNSEVLDDVDVVPILSNHAWPSATETREGTALASTSYDASETPEIHPHKVDTRITDGALLDVMPPAVLSSTSRHDLTAASEITLTPMMELGDALQKAVSSLQVSASFLAPREIHIELKPEVLTGVKILIRELHGRIQVDFICSVEASRRFLEGLTAREAGVMARRCKRDLLIRVRPDMPSDPDSPEYDENVREILGTA